MTTQAQQGGSAPQPPAPPAQRATRWWQRRQNILAALVWATLIALAVTWWPTNLGGASGFVVVSGNSMLPTYTSGDLVITRASDNIQVGDVIVYTVPQGEPGAGLSVIHRVIDGNATQGWITLGDNNPSPDPWRPVQEDLLGVVTHHIPRAGQVMMLVKSPLVLAAFGAFVVGYVLWPTTSREGDSDAGTGEGAAKGARPRASS